MAFIATYTDSETGLALAGAYVRLSMFSGTPKGMNITVEIWANASARDTARPDDNPEALAPVTTFYAQFEPLKDDSGRAAESHIDTEGNVHLVPNEFTQGYDYAKTMPCFSNIQEVRD